MTRPSTLHRAFGSRVFLFVAVMWALFWSGLALASESDTAASQIVRTHCTVCHDAKRICPHLDVFDRQGWEKTVARMVEHGAKLDVEQERMVVEYLSGSPTDFPDCADQGDRASLGSFATILLLGHPTLMTLNVVLALWVFFLGLQRFRATVMGRRARFPWKTHVRFGYVAMALFVLGMVAGPTMTTIFWGDSGGSSTHFVVGLCMAPLVLVGFFTGRLMDKHKAKRRVMPLVHGANNLLLLFLALWQFLTGAPMALSILS